MGAGLGLLPLPATFAGAFDPQRLGFLMALTFLLFAVALFGAIAVVAIRPKWAKPAAADQAGGAVRVTRR